MLCKLRPTIKLNHLHQYRSFSTAPLSSPCIDVHTHVYLPRYVELLKSRQEIPKIIVNDKNENRLVILPSDDEIKNNRKIGSEYFDINSKLQFMDKHNISKSIISLANPWLDFLSSNKSESCKYAQLFNQDLQEICDKSDNKIYAFGCLPNHNDTNNNANIKDCIKEIEYISSSLPSIKGIIIGAHGIFGAGMDDENCLDIYQCLAENNLFIFIHPHYGIGNEYYNNYGHSLYLALGFTFETTVCISRFILSGILDKIEPDLKLLLAHCGGTLPFLCGRLDYCYNYDEQLIQNKGLKKSPIEYIKSGNNLYFDGITFEENALMNAISLIGGDRIMFGTDHPFFPPPGFNAELNNDLFWTSTVKNQQIIQNLECNDIVKRNIFHDNASRILNLGDNTMTK